MVWAEVHYTGESEEGFGTRVLKVVDSRELWLHSDADEHRCWGWMLKLPDAEALASALLEDICGEYAAQEYARPFAEGVLARLDPDHFRLTASEIESWVTQHESRRQLERAASMETVYYSATKTGDEREVLKIVGDKAVDFRPDIQKYWGMGVEEWQAIPFARALLTDAVGETLAEKYASQFAEGVLCLVDPDHYMTSSWIIADWVKKTEAGFRF